MMRAVHSSTRGGGGGRPVRLGSLRTIPQYCSQNRLLWAWGAAAPNFILDALTRLGIPNECTPYTAAELREDQKQDLTKISAVNPELAAAGVKAGDDAVNAYCKLHPQECSIALDFVTIKNPLGLPEGKGESLLVWGAVAAGVVAAVALTR